jgi:hypothetical protein
MRRTLIRYRSLPNNLLHFRRRRRIATVLGADDAAGGPFVLSKLSGRRDDADVIAAMAGFTGWCS